MSYRLGRDRNGMLTYTYDAGPDIRFVFHTLAEVGEPYQPWFKSAIKAHGWTVVTRELDAKPWVADFVKEPK